MILDVHLDPLADRDFYTSLDVVSGTVCVHVEKTVKISQISISLQGRITSSAMSTDYQDPSIVVQEGHHFHRLFKTSRILFPTPYAALKSPSYTFGKGLHEFRFAINFPMLSSCVSMHSNLNPCDAYLPPSLTIDASELKSRVRYLLRAKVKKCGTLLRRALTEKELTFFPIDRTFSPPGINNSNSSKGVSALPAETLGARQHSISTDSLPLYSPALLFEGMIEESAAISPGSSLPLRLYIIIPNELSQRLSIKLHSLNIGIQTRTTLKLRNHLVMNMSEAPMRKIDFNLAIQSSAMEFESLELDSSYWEHCKIPEIPPSFASCILRQDHFLQVVAELSTNLKPRSTFATLCIPINVHGKNAPPPYTEV